MGSEIQSEVKTCDRLKNEVECVCENCKPWLCCIDCDNEFESVFNLPIIALRIAYLKLESKQNNFDDFCQKLLDKGKRQKQKNKFRRFINLADERVKQDPSNEFARLVQAVVNNEGFDFKKKLKKGDKSETKKSYLQLLGFDTPVNKRFWMFLEEKDIKDVIESRKTDNFKSRLADYIKQDLRDHLVKNKENPENEKQVRKKTR